MAHLNGKIYVDTESTPNVGISINDIQQTLGSGKKDIGGLITTGNINKWSKIKPLRGGGVGYLVADGNNFRGSEYPSYNCGFSAAKAFETPASFAQAIAATGFFTYRKPVAGNKFRFMDFNGYNHNAQSPYFQTLAPASVDVSGNQGIPVTFNFNLAQPEGSLTYGDLYGDNIVGTWYLGVVYYNPQSMNTPWVVTQAYPLNQMDPGSNPLVLQIPRSSLTTNKIYSIIPCFSTSAYTTPVIALDALSYLYPIEDELLSVRTYEQEAENITITNATATYSQSTGNYHVTFTATIPRAVVQRVNNPRSYYTIAYGGQTGGAFFSDNTDLNSQYGTFNITFDGTSSTRTAVIITVNVANGDTGEVDSQNQLQEAVLPTIIS